MRKLCVALAASCAFAALGAEPAPKIGLALSGGGTKGGAHVGVLKVLEELGVQVDFVAGTSVGAIIGGLYAAGLSPNEIERAIAGIDWDDILRDEPRRRALPPERKRDGLNYLVAARPGWRNGKLLLPLGLTHGQKVTQFLRRELTAVTAIDDFDRLPIPFRAVAASLASGEPVVISRGDLPTAIRASMSVPGVYTPVERDGERLIDGGVANNLPVDVVRAMGADIVIAVDITTPLLEADRIDSVLQVSEQLVNFLTARNTAAQRALLTPRDVLITPDFEAGISLDFTQALATMDAGMMATRAQQDRLAELAMDNTGAESSMPQSDTSPVIEFIEVVDDSALSRKAIAARLDIPLNEPLDRGQVALGIERLYGSGLYQSIDYKVVEINGRSGLLVNARARSWGPNYLQFGFRLEEDFSADTDVNIGIAYTRTAMNRLGASWRTQLDIGARQGVSTEWQQPLAYGGRFFTRALLEYERRNLRVFDAAGDALSDLRIAGTGFELTAGAYSQRATTVDLTWKRLIGVADVFVGTTAPPDDSFEIGELSLNLEYDSLDAINRPSSGARLRISGILSDRSTGGDIDYAQLTGFATQALRVRDVDAQLSLESGVTREENAPLQSQFSLGGLGRLSGYPVDRFFGQHFALARLTLSTSVRDSWTLPAFAGLSLEAGNVWDASDDVTGRDWLAAGALFAGVETFLGPVYLAWGFAEGDENAVYMYLGNPFLNRTGRTFD